MLRVHIPDLSGKTRPSFLEDRATSCLLYNNYGRFKGGKVVRSFPIYREGATNLGSGPS
jgi:hypothetical protein